MTAAVEVVRYRPEHKSAVLRLETQLWSGDARFNAAYFEWKYEQNPYLREPAVYLALQGGEAIAARGFFGGHWEAGDPAGTALMLCADDLVIAPEHRNRGLFTALMRGAFDDLARGEDGFAMTLSGGSVTVLGSLTMGWKSIGHMRPMIRESPRAQRRRRVVKFLNEQRGLWRVARAAERPPWRERERFARLDANARGRPDAAPAIRLSRDPAPEAMAALVSRLGHDGRIRHVRDARYFAWRFRNPMHEYRFLYAGGPALDGYMVLQRDTKGVDAARVHLSDWEAADARTRRALLRAAVSWGDFRRLTTWTATMPEESRQLLAEHGFADPPWPQSPAWPCILVRPLRQGTEAPWQLARRPLLDLGSWDLRMLYAMSG